MAQKSELKSELKSEYIEKYQISADYILSRLTEKPELAIIAGTGFSDFFENENILLGINYSDIPYFPQPTVAGHSGRLLLIELSGKFCLVFMGRFHVYEGAAIDEIASPAIVSHLMGINLIIFTNAAGGLNPNIALGEAMIIHSTINFLNRDTSGLFISLPHSGENNVFSNEELFSSEWQEKIKIETINARVVFHEGVYLSTTGPSFETPAEIRFFRKLGADAAGMSTILEAQAANRLGMECLGLSLVTNCLSETHTSEVSHEDILLVSQKAKPHTKKLLEIAIKVSSFWLPVSDKKQFIR